MMLKSVMDVGVISSKVPEDMEHNLFKIQNIDLHKLCRITLDIVALPICSINLFYPTLHKYYRFAKLGLGSHIKNCIFFFFYIFSLLQTTVPGGTVSVLPCQALLPRSFAQIWSLFHPTSTNTEQ